MPRLSAVGISGLQTGEDVNDDLSWMTPEQRETPLAKLQDAIREHGFTYRTTHIDGRSEWHSEKTGGSIETAGIITQPSSWINCVRWNDESWRYIGVGGFLIDGKGVDQFEQMLARLCDSCHARLGTDLVSEARDNYLLCGHCQNEVPDALELAKAHAEDRV